MNMRDMMRPATSVTNISVALSPFFYFVPKRITVTVTVRVSTQLYQISLLFGYGERDPMNNNKDCRVGQLTNIQYEQWLLLNNHGIRLVPVTSNSFLCYFLSKFLLSFRKGLYCLPNFFCNIFDEFCSLYKYTMTKGKA